MLQFITKKSAIDKNKKSKIDDALTEFVITTNQSFLTSDNHFFRKLIFAAEPNYVAPSDTTVVRNCDKKGEEIRKLLKLDIIKDLENVDHNHKVASITIDGGTSKDNKKTKKNAVTLHRTTKDFQTRPCSLNRIYFSGEIKSDTLAVIKICGSQNAEDIRKQLKEVLDKYGYDSSWKINATTDGARVMVSVSFCLDQIVTEISDLEAVHAGGPGKNFLQNLLHGMDKRFPEQYKKEEPFNALTALDPRQKLLYANTPDLKRRIEDVIHTNPIFDKMAEDLSVERSRVPAATGHVEMHRTTNTQLSRR